MSALLMLIVPSVMLVALVEPVLISIVPPKVVTTPPTAMEATPGCKPEPGTEPGLRPDFKISESPDPDAPEILAAREILPAASNSRSAPPLFAVRTMEALPFCVIEPSSVVPVVPVYIVTFVPPSRLATIVPLVMVAGVALASNVPLDQVPPAGTPLEP